MDTYYKQPNYYSDFKCSGGECPLSCCKNWRIDWYDNEYENLKLLFSENDCIPDPEKNFFKNENSENLFSICIDEDGRCPYLDKSSGLCLIQKNFGEDNLGVTCRIYPRTFYNRDNIIFRMCSSSCPEVVRMLIDDNNSAKLSMYKAHDADKIFKPALHFDSVSEVEKSTYLIYRMHILDFYVWMFDLKTSMDNIVVLGALAAKKISDAHLNGAVDSIPEIIKSLKKQFNSSATISSVDEIKPNYEIKYIAVNNMLVQYIDHQKRIISEVSALHDGTRLIAENFFKGKDSFERVFSDNDWALKNIALNVFYDVFIHLNYTKFSFWDMYAYYTLCVATIQILGYAAGFSEENIKNKFIVSVSEFCRSVSHGSVKPKRLTDYIKELGLTSPAHLALIIKG